MSKQLLSVTVSMTSFAQKSSSILKNVTASNQTYKFHIFGRYCSYSYRYLFTRLDCYTLSVHIILTACDIHGVISLYCISLSLSHKFRLTPKISQKLTKDRPKTDQRSAKDWPKIGRKLTKDRPKTEVIFRLDSAIRWAFAETKLWTEGLLNSKLINSSVDSACTRSDVLITQSKIKIWWLKITSFFRQFKDKQRNMAKSAMSRRWCQRWR